MPLDGYQHDIVKSYTTKLEVILNQARKVLALCRQNKVTFIYIAIQFRSGYPEIDIQNKLFSGLSKSGRFLLGLNGAAIHESVHPKGG